MTYVLRDDVFFGHKLAGWVPMFEEALNHGPFLNFIKLAVLALFALLSNTLFDELTEPLSKLDNIVRLTLTLAKMLSESTSALQRSFGI